VVCDCSCQICPGDLSRLRGLEEENRQLKHAVVELLLDKRALQAVVAKKIGEPAVAKQAEAVMDSEVAVSERRACGPDADPSGQPRN
jgi:hypothetical protein